MLDNQKHKTMPATKVPLNLTLCPVTFSAVDQQSDTFLEHFKTDNTIWTNPVEEIINFNRFNTKFMSITAPDNGHYIDAVRIHFGLETTAGGNDVIKLIYQPVMLIRKASPEDCIYDINAITDGQGNELYYTYNGTDFIPSSNHGALKQNYLDNIRIKHTQLGVHGPHNTGDTITHDAKSVLFPIQEIEELWVDNSQPAALHVVNVSKIDANSGIYKHSIVISIQTPQKFNKLNFHTGIFLGAAANLGNLCPPNCNDVMIKNDMILIQPLPDCS